jgi:hypothetical protein
LSFSYAAFEIFTSESTYLLGLMELECAYRQPLINKGRGPNSPHTIEEVNLLFGNIQSLMRFVKLLLLLVVVVVVVVVVVFVDVR